MFNLVNYNIIFSFNNEYLYTFTYNICILHVSQQKLSIVIENDPDQQWNISGT